MNRMREPIITIDGTAASGKSTTARKIAEHFRYQYIDTGAMYRAVTLKALQKGIDIADQSALVSMLKDTDINFDHKNGSVRVYLDRVDVTEDIRMPEVTENVSAVSEVKQVREVLVEKQRELGRGGGVVMEGRDIGTVVFPHADVKIFMATGMCTMDEIENAVTILRKYGIDYELMHCNSTYPMKDEDANLEVIHTLEDEFLCKVGYSGHESGIQISTVAVALGATSIERHITLDRAMYGSDQSASLEPEGLKRLVRDIRIIDKAMGDGVKRVTEQEKKIKEKLAKPYWTTL